MGINDRDLHGWREQIVLTPALPLVPLVAQRFSNLDKLTNVLPFAAFCGICFTTVATALFFTGHYTAGAELIDAVRTAAGARGVTLSVYDRLMLRLPGAADRISESDNDTVPASRQLANGRSHGGHGPGGEIAV